MDRIYISAVAQHAGKTTTSLGIYRRLEDVGRTVCYIKPVGQRYLEYEGHAVDEDAVLFREYLKCPTPVDALTAVTVPRGFTEQYIFNRNRAYIYDEIDKAMMKLDENLDVTIIEGTGHAGVGSVFDASNATVACLLGAKAIIIAGGGIGKCLDEIALNEALFRQEHVEVLGAVINKVLVDKYEKVNHAVRQGLSNMGIECLGVIPYEPDLTFPTVDQLVQDCKLTVIRADDTGMMNHVQHNVVVAVSPERVTAGLKEDTMLIVPEGCLDLFRSGLAAISAAGSLDKVSCILFTDGIEPPDAVLEELAPCGVPLLTTSSDTFRMAAKLGSLIVKISPRDPVKVEAACDLMKAHLDIDRILAGL